MFGTTPTGTGSSSYYDATGDPDEQFDSLRLQGGDITRQLYKWQRDHEPDSIANKTRTRAKSFDIPRPVDPENLNIKSTRQPF